MAVTDYASIRTEINLHADRTYSQSQIDTFIGLFEADAQLELGPNYQRETSATVAVASGTGSLPAGFIRPISLSHATYGVLDLKTRDALIAYNPTGAAGIPTQWAIEGASLYVAFSMDGSYTLNYEGAFAPLTSLNTTNWLLALAPQSYFWGVMAQVKAFQKDFQNAAILGAKAMDVVRKVAGQSMSGQFARASLKLHGPTP